jgi:hypothetical protein
MKAGIHTQFPQGPRNRTIVLSPSLPYLDAKPSSITVIQCRIFENLLRNAIPTTNKSLRLLIEFLPSCVCRWDRDSTALKDELEAYLPDIPPPSVDDHIKSLCEFRVYNSMLRKIRSFHEIDEDMFLEILLEVHRRLGVGVNQIRNSPVWTRRDATGNAVRYPDHTECRKLLSKLHAFNLRNADNPMLCAVLGYAAIIHIHPFDDGNGRTARTYFNLVLGSTLGFQHFVPLQTLIAYWRGGFILKLRRALYSGDLLPLVGYFGTLSRISCSLQRTAR